MAVHTLNRKIQPPQKAIDSVEIPNPLMENLPNGLKIAFLNSGDQDIVKLELIFRAGTRYQQKPIVAKASISQLIEGTASKSSKDISEFLDFTGSFIEFSNDRDFASVSTLTTNKHLKPILELLVEMLEQPTFPQSELDVYKKRGKQNLLVELEKVSTVARMNFFKKMFGENHPYGTYAIPSDYDLLNRDDIYSFHKAFHDISNAFLVVTGKLSDTEIDAIKNAFAQISSKHKVALSPINIANNKQSDKRIFSLKKDATQTAIRMGMPTIKRNHPDFIGLSVLNTILGGYFGSRLMQNIREEKGYTYGIYSTILPFEEVTVFLIASEVGKNFANQTITEIYNEIEKLKTSAITDNELNLVKNYLLGEILRTFDGPLALADSLSSLYQYNNFEIEFFEKTINTVNTITPKILQDIANKYLNTDNIVESIAGIID
ncbi:MAG TPA: pitrilysin family protein [Tenuifilaceae bacterium]|nr:pitrilysin family protein [Tenuifilaceae bacterium]